ncbi:MAG: HEAT repeat domain-containing protein [Gammaproteobacteria bacterium]
MTKVLKLRSIPLILIAVLSSGCPVDGGGDRAAGDRGRSSIAADARAAPVRVTDSPAEQEPRPVAVEAVPEPPPAAVQASPTAGESSREEALRLARELAQEQEDPLTSALREAQEALAENEAARRRVEEERTRRLATGEDPSQIGALGPDRQYAARYAQALAGLGAFQDAKRLEVLSPALEYDDTGVRMAALRALRDGTVHDPAVLSRVREMLIGEPDPGVQREALEVYVRYGDPDDVLSLVQTLARKEGPMRDIAVREWNRIEMEQAEAAAGDPQID